MATSPKECEAAPETLSRRQRRALLGRGPGGTGIGPYQAPVSALPPSTATVVRLTPMPQTPARNSTPSV